MSEEVRRSFGRHLRTLRERANLSLEQVAERTGQLGERVTKSYLSRCELGGQLPDLPRLRVLAKVYGRSISLLAANYETSAFLATRMESRRGGKSYSFESEMQNAAHSSRAGLHEDALASLARAGELSDRQPDPAAAERNVSLAIAVSLSALGRTDEARQAAVDLIAESDEDPEMSGRAIVLLANTYAARSAYHVAAAIIRGFEDRVRLSPPEIRAQARLVLSNALRNLGDYHGAEAAARKALTEYGLVQQKIDPAALAVPHYILGQALALGGKTNLALRKFAESRTLWKRGGAPIKVAQAYNESGEVYLRASNHAAARRHLLRAARLAREQGALDLLLVTYVHLWEVEVALGHKKTSASYRRLAKRIRRSLPREHPTLRSYGPLLELMGIDRGQKPRDTPRAAPSRKRESRPLSDGRRLKG